MKESFPVSAMAHITTTANGNGNLVDEFEETFQYCLNALTKEEAISLGENDEIKVEVDHTTFRFVDLARQMEAFFLQKRFLLSALKPEMVIREDLSELRLELARKEEILKRHIDKVSMWQNLLNELKGYSKNFFQDCTGLLGNSGNIPQIGEMVPGTCSQNTPSGLEMTSEVQLQQEQLHHQSNQRQLQNQHQHMQASFGVPSGIDPDAVSSDSLLKHQSGLQLSRVPFLQQSLVRADQGPLAYLEKSASNIGLRDGRR
ncbi:hypothetical protein WA026_010058 [Henosepilachna vigintioctopunctata]|uniref:Mediator of RNA polymerase II transcription subunit 28 n=1 Tax=Henosepilachna vigintioctopunctata TaxID=420089 RepID=A0AAW1UGJ9_9CUCU